MSNIAKGDRINEKIFCVYILINPIDKSPFYIGEGLLNRPNSHWNHFLSILNENKKAKKDDMKNTFKYNELFKIYNAGLEPIVKIYANKIDKFQSLKVEKILVNKYGLRIDKTGILTNLTRDQTISPSMYEHVKQKLRGQKRTDEQKETMRKAANRREKFTEEHCFNISKSLIGNQYLLGHKHTEETKDKQRKAILGIKRSEETKIKHKELYNGSNFDNTGKNWYTNGKINILLFSYEKIPDGWWNAQTKRKSNITDERKKEISKRRKDSKRKASIESKEKMSLAQSGENHPQFGKRYYNNGIEEIKINKNEIPPKGFVRFRLKNK